MKTGIKKIIKNNYFIEKVKFLLNNGLILMDSLGEIKNDKRKMECKEGGRRSRKRET